MVELNPEMDVFWKPWYFLENMTFGMDMYDMC